MIRIGLDLAAQSGHVHIHNPGFRVSFGGIAPDVFEDFDAVNGLAYRDDDVAGSAARYQAASETWFKPFVATRQHLLKNYLRNDVLRTFYPLSGKEHGMRAFYELAVRFGLIPQVLPIITSQWLYYIESNTRSATIIGIVGAGGIGLHLSEMIRTLEWQQVSFIVLLILATVALIDALSSKIRFAIIGPRAL